MTTRFRAMVAVGMTFVAFASIGLHQAFSTAWSNHCDPGNAQFNLLKNDPVVKSHPTGALVTWENDGPDNSWLCSAPTLSVSYLGPDHNSLFDQANAAMVNSGWQLIPMPDVHLSGWTDYEKQAAGAVHLDAFVRMEPLWVEIDLNAPGLHVGDPGFQ